MVLGLAAGLFACAVLLPWPVDASVRRAVGIVLAVLVLWIGEVAPLGVIALVVPVAATLSGVLKWGEALAAWGDPIVFLFLGTFLLAGALDKHGVFERLGSMAWGRSGAAEGSAGTGSGVSVGALCMIVLLVSGAISTVQNNTAVTAMLLPVVVTLARRTTAPALPLLALSYGATFGGMATPVGTAPNFLGFAKIQLVDPRFNFLTWMKVGIPVWIGTTVIGWGLLTLARRWARPHGEPGDLRTHLGTPGVNDRLESRSPTGGYDRQECKFPAGGEDGLECLSPTGGDGGLESRCPTDGNDRLECRSPTGGDGGLESRCPTDGDDRLECRSSTGGDGGLEARPPDSVVARSSARRWAVGMFAAAAVTWLATGAIISSTAPHDRLHEWVKAYLPESLVPLAAALVLFVVRPRGGDRAVLDRSDLQSLDWDTLFLIAGGLCLGKVLQSSGAADALAMTVAGADLTPLTLMFALAGVTVLLSELTSNTATAALLVPLAGSLADEVGVPAVKLIWLVALSASLGFALPISTPPNAIVYGTRLIPLRLMAVMGLLVDALSVAWVVACVQWLA